MSNYKYVAVSCAIMLCIGAPLGYTATVGNTARLDSPGGVGLFSLKQDKKYTVKAGLDAEFLMDRKLHANASSNAKFDSAEWYMAKFSVVAFDRFEPYVKLGSAHYTGQWNESGVDLRLESDSSFAWGVGTKVFLGELKKYNLKFLGDWSYRMADLQAKRAWADGNGFAIDGNRSKFFVTEWQISLLAATEIDVSGGNRETAWGVTSLIPYGGIKYSQVGGRMRISVDNALFFNPGKIDADSHFGLFAGCDFVGPNSVSFSIEGRFLDETALTAGLSVLF